MQKTYGCDQVQKLVNAYMEKGGIAYELEPGTLGYGLTVCIASGCKTAVIREQYENMWSSTHTIRFYNRIPLKYANMITDRFPDDAALEG